MALNWDIIDKVIYINLAERSDRKQSIKQQLRQLQVPAHKIVRFNACRHLLGHIGCSQSHLAVLDMALEQQWGNILVLEDDMCFNHTAENYAALEFTFDTLQTLQWDVTLLSANYLHVIPFKSTRRLVKPINALSTCAYVVNAQYQQTLRDNFAESVERLLQGGAKNQYALDVHWLQLMRCGRWLGMHPVAGHQLAGTSDIENVAMDYTEQFYKNIADIAVEVST